MLLSHDAPNGNNLGTKVQASGAPAASWAPGEHKSTGAALNIVRGELAELGQRLGELLEGPAQKLIQHSQRVLQDMACRIVVIGQVKAGKSSFINCLMHQPGLVPTDVNPWTTAVTRLHFGKRDAPLDIAAEFRFFEADEWQKLAAGGGHIRQLTERLVPGFEAALLAQQLETMRQRAVTRLGSELDQLLGTSHTFPAISRSILEAYVCSGIQSTSRTNAPLNAPAAGRYSDITKTADLYLDGNPFGFPTTLIDTPGTNDPFLVRDEITRRSLDTADLYVVVLTARQALSMADVAMLRILRGLRKDRIVVFVNRIDELDNLEGDLEAVQTQIEQGLRREFREIEIPIVYGSAHWAGQALTNTAGGSLVLTPALRAYAKRLGLATHSGVSAAGRSSTELMEDPRDILFLCSGLSQLAQALDRSMLQSQPAHVIRHLATHFSELSRLGAMATREELRRMTATIETVAHSASAGGKERSDLADELRRLQTLALALERSVSDFEVALTSTAEQQLAALETSLGRVVERFAHLECLRMGEAMHDGNRGRIWRCDTGPLRQKLEDEFGRLFRSAEARILAAETEIFPSLQRAVAQVLPGEFRAQGLELRPTPMQSPNISSLGRVVALDLDEPWWKAWWTGRREDRERMRELDRLIRVEFSPIAEDLVRSAREQLLAQISATARQAGAVCLSIVGQLRMQGERQVARMNDLEGNKDRGAIAAGSVQRLTEFNDQLKSWDSICLRLDTLRAVCARLA